MAQDRAKSRLEGTDCENPEIGRAAVRRDSKPGPSGPGLAFAPISRSELLCHRSCCPSGTPPAGSTPSPCLHLSRSTRLSRTPPPSSGRLRCTCRLSYMHFFPHCMPWPCRLWQPCHDRSTTCRPWRPPSPGSRVSSIRFCFGPARLCQVWDFGPRQACSGPASISPSSGISFFYLRISRFVFGRRTQPTRSQRSRYGESCPGRSMIVREKPHPPLPPRPWSQPGRRAQSRWPGVPGGAPGKPPAESPCDRMIRNSVASRTWRAPITALSVHACTRNNDAALPRPAWPPSMASNSSPGSATSPRPAIFSS